MKPDWFFPMVVVALGSWIVGLGMAAEFPLSLISLVGIAFVILGGYLMRWELGHWECRHKKVKP